MSSTDQAPESPPPDRTAYYDIPPSEDRISRYKLVKDMAEGITRGIQSYIVWALLAFFAREIDRWPAYAAMHIMGMAIFAYVVVTPVLALLEFHRSNPGRQAGIYFIGAIAAVIIFWGLGVQALMWSDIVIGEINRLTHGAR